MSNPFNPDGPDPATDPIAKARAVAKTALPKRFYAAVSLGTESDGHVILLDGRPVRTPARMALVLPHLQLAEAVAEEWRAQGQRIDPATMPVTRLANTAIDGIAEHAGEVADDIARYGGSDLLYYRADSPDRLVARQTDGWDPLVRWAEGRIGHRLHLAAGVMPVEQDAGTVPAFRALMPTDPFRLAGLHVMTTLTGSVILALAILEGRLSVDEAWSLAHIDEDWTNELWGIDEEAAVRRSYRRAEMDAAARLIDG